MSNELADRQFEYLLNAMENAAQSASPALQGYGEKRKAVLDYVAALRSEPVAWTAHGIKREDTCIWMQDSDGTWNTSCGKVFEFTNAGPAENEANFCYHCGGALLPEPYSDDAAPSRESRTDRQEPGLSAETINRAKWLHEQVHERLDDKSLREEDWIRYKANLEHIYKEHFPALCDMALRSLTAPTVSEKGEQDADELLREVLDWGLPDDLKQRIDAHLARKEQK